MKIVKYGLMKKGELLGVSFSSVDAEDCYCNDTTCVLNDDSDEVWLADSKEHAEHVLNNSTPWYNSCYNTPQHSCERKFIKGVKVVRVTLIVEEI